ncbi:oxidoreductase [Deinococcus sp. PESE-13]
MTIHPVLQPVALGSHQLKNRAVVAPMTRISATSDGVPTPLMADYYARFANGGFALIITEGIYPDQTRGQAYGGQPGLETSEQQAGWTEVVNRAHAEGALIVAQLMHAGALSQCLPETYAPSAIQPLRTMLKDYGGEGPFRIPKAMTTEEIHETINTFVQAARRAHAAGFDGVELHGANGYLIDQFITEYTNKRTDDYGGSLPKRLHFVKEVISAVRSALPTSFLVGVRLSQGKVNDFHYRWPGGSQEAEIIFAAVKDAGVDYIHVASEGTGWEASARMDNHESVTSIARRVSGLPVIANGGMHDLLLAARVLQNADADLLSLGTGALANPDWPQRIARGEDIRPFDPSWISPDVTLKRATTQVD